MFTRYAIYFTPPQGSDLAEFGAAWLGWNSATGTTVPHPQTGLDLPAITANPRKYGFHGTIKPPFRLAAQHTADGLNRAVADLCRTAAPVDLAGLHLARLGRFLALVPTGDSSALGALAAQAVRDLDPFRAPMTAAEYARRTASRLTPAQRAHLDRWGYPFVMDEFRFHLTLTDRLDGPTADRTTVVLQHMLAPLDLAPFRIDALSLLGEDTGGRFHEIARHPLTGVAPRNTPET